EERRRARRDQRTDAGHGRGLDQACDDRGAAVARPREARVPAHHAGARRARARSAASRARSSKGGAAEAYERCRTAESTSCSRCGIGTELGKSALSLRHGGVPAALPAATNPVETQEETVQPDSVQEGGSSPDVIRHLVLLGDALENLDLGMNP